MMNLPEFLARTDQLTGRLTREQLADFIHQQARILPEDRRADYLRLLGGYGDGGEEPGQPDGLPGEEGIHQKAERLLEQLHRINEGELKLRAVLNEEYDDWYSSGEDEFSYEDPEGILEVVGEVRDFVHSSIDTGCCREAYELSDALLSIEFQSESDYDVWPMALRELEYQKLISFDVRQFVLDSLYAAYQCSPLEERPEAVYSLIWNSGLHDIRVEELMQKGNSDLGQFGEFLELWIACLGEKKDSLAERLLREAVTLLGDPRRALEVAAENAARHPGIYETVLHMESFDDGMRLESGKAALEQIPVQYVIRSRIALLTADSALRIGRQEEAERFWLEAYRSDTNPVNYLRIAANAGDYGAYREELGSICAELLDDEVLSDFYYGWHHNEGYELATNKLNFTNYYALTFLQGDFERVLQDAMNVKKALGWSSTFMKNGITLFLLYLYEGGKLPKGCGMLQWTLRTSLQFTAEEYTNGLAGIEDRAAQEDELFWGCFQRWRDRTDMPEELKGRVLGEIDRMIENRIQGIMEANRRSYYGECAAFVAALGEVLESRGESGGKLRMLERYRDKYPRRSAFRRELDGMRRS